MSLSSKRIVLVDPLGEVLFSGESLIGTAHVATREREAREACPETQRSAADDGAGSGIYRTVKRVIVEAEDDVEGGVETEIPTLRRKTA